MVTWALLAAVGCSACSGGIDLVGNPDTAGNDSATDTGGDTADTGDSTIDSDTSTQIDSCDENGSLGEGSDADGDGFIALEEGGDDCDDTRDNVYPGAPDPCDDLDQDCDGDPVPPGSCGEAGDIAAAAWVVIEGNADVPYVQFASASLNADGQAWMAIDGADVQHDASSRLGFFDGSTLGSNPRPAVENWSGTWGDALGTAAPAGDVDGDGVGDAWALWQSAGSVYATFALLPGPLSGPPCTLDEVHDRAATAVSNSTVGGSSIYMWDAGFDVDGDGLGDARVSLNPSSGEVREYLLDGATAATLEGEIELDRTFGYATRDSAAGLGATPVAVADLDGDGLDDMVMEHECGRSTYDGGVAVVTGADFVAAVASGGTLGDGASLVCSRSEDHTWSLMLNLWNAPDRAADVDGDGHVDLLLAGEATPEDAGFLAFIDLHNPDSTPMEDRVLVEVAGAGSNAAYAAGLVRGTHFGVTPSDQWIGVIGTRGGCIWRVADLDLGGVTEANSLRGPCIQDPDSWYTTLEELVDLDGDGLPEWLFEDSGETIDGVPLGRVTVIHGFEPPYDDATRW